MRRLGKDSGAMPRGQALWMGVLAWCVAVTVARAIRFPNNFAEGHWLLDYRFGFTKRGLVGSIGAAVTEITGTTMTAQAILVMATLFFTVFLATVLFALARVVRPAVSHPATILAALVFTTSPFFVLYAHTFGSFDAILHGLAIIAVALVLSGRPYWGAAVQALAILIHENFILNGFPMAVLAAVLVCLPAENRARWRAHAAALAIPALTFAGIVAYHSLVIDPVVLRAQLEEHLASFPFIHAPGIAVAEFQTTGFFEYLRYQYTEFVPRILEPSIFTALAPTMLALLYFAHARFRVPPFSPLSILLIGAALTPMAMHAVAWDTVRISGFALGCAFLAVWVLSETRPAEGACGLFALIAIPALVLNVFGHSPLMDDEVERFGALARALLYSPAFVMGGWAMLQDDRLRRSWTPPA